MAAPLDPRLATLLTRLVELDDDYDTFHPYFSGGSEGEAELVGHGDERVPEGPLRELDRLGYINMRIEPGKRLGPFAITSEGRTLAAQLAAASDGAIDLSWATVRLILAQIYDLWRGASAPPLGIAGETIQAHIQPPLESSQLGVVLRELERADWIEIQSGWGPPLPLAVRPSPRALALLEGWPSSDARVVGEQFLAHLEGRIEGEPDEEKRSKLRQALAAGGTTFRELTVEVAGALLARQVGAS